MQFSVLQPRELHDLYLLYENGKRTQWSTVHNIHPWTPRLNLFTVSLATGCRSFPFTMLITYNSDASMEIGVFTTVAGALLLLLSLRWILQQRFPLWALPHTSISARFKSAIEAPPGALSQQITDAVSKKGPVVRIGINEVAVTDTSLARTLYASFLKWPEWYESPEDKLFYGYIYNVQINMTGLALIWIKGNYRFLA